MDGRVTGDGGGAQGEGGNHVIPRVCVYTYTIMSGDTAAGDHNRREEDDQEGGTGEHGRVRGIGP